MSKTNITGAGIGLRRPHIPEISEQWPKAIDFIEFAPENWLKVGGSRAKALTACLEHYPAICHGLSLSIGGPAPLDEAFIRQMKQFFDAHDIQQYSEHLSYCSDGGQLYDLLPMPFTEEAVSYVAQRVRRVQDILERRIALENISYYMLVGAEMTEADFINAVLQEANCDLLLDVNNVYVNSVNHGYDPKSFIASLHPKRIAYIHIAGHYRAKPDLIIDTHAEDIIDPVYDLLAFSYEHFGIIPTLLERDDNLPSLDTMLSELDKIKTLQHQAKRENVHES